MQPKRAMSDFGYVSPAGIILFNDYVQPCLSGLPFSAMFGHTEQIAHQIAGTIREDGARMNGQDHVFLKRLARG